MVSSVTITCDWNVLQGASKLFWFEQHKCKSLKNVKPSCKAVFEKEEELNKIRRKWEVIRAN